MPCSYIYKCKTFPKQQCPSYEGRAIRTKAFQLGVSTGHNPAYPELKYTKDHIWEGFERYLEDPGYTQPKINLTRLGQSLLGY